MLSHQYSYDDEEEYKDYDSSILIGCVEVWFSSLHTREGYHVYHPTRTALEKVDRGKNYHVYHRYHVLRHSLSRVLDKLDMIVGRKERVGIVRMNDVQLL